MIGLFKCVIYYFLLLVEVMNAWLRLRTFGVNLSTATTAFARHATPYTSTSNINILRNCSKLNSSNNAIVHDADDQSNISVLTNHLLRTEEYDEFDKLVSKMDINNSPLGIQTTVLKSYIVRQNWKDAIQLFEVSFMLPFLSLCLYI